MGLFNIFKSKEENINPNYSIFDEFKIDLRNLDKYADDFSEMDDETNSSGEIIKVYFSTSFKELDLFDSIEYYDFRNGRKNIFLDFALSNDMDITPLVKLINRLYKNLGKDDIGKKEFEDKEMQQITNITWLGRSYSKVKTPFSISQTGGMIKLTIWT